MCNCEAWSICKLLFLQEALNTSPNASSKSIKKKNCFLWSMWSRILPGYDNLLTQRNTSLFWQSLTASHCEKQASRRSVGWAWSLADDLRAEVKNIRNKSQVSDQVLTNQQQSYSSQAGEQGRHRNGAWVHSQNSIMVARKVQGLVNRCICSSGSGRLMARQIHSCRTEQRRGWKVSP